MCAQPEWPKLAVTAPQLLAHATVRMMVGQMGASGTKTRPLALAFVRITARALFDYDRVREANIQAHGSLPDLFRSVQAIGDLEACIVNLHRALTFLEALKNRGLTTWNGDLVPLKPRDLPALAADSRRRLVALRDAITHMDERIGKGDFPVGVPIAPQVKDGLITLEGTEIAVAELARWLNFVAGVAIKIAERGARGLAD
jgi:hypothetical protein